MGERESDVRGVPRPSVAEALDMAEEGKEAIPSGGGGVSGRSELREESCESFFNLLCLTSSPCLNAESQGQKHHEPKLAELLNQDRQHHGRIRRRLRRRRLPDFPWLSVPS